METKVPFVRNEGATQAFIIKIVIYGLLCFLFYQFDHKFFFIYAFMAYLFIFLASKILFIAGSLYTGIKFIKQQRFKDAIPFIEKDIEYFTKKAWIDRFRFFLLLSSSGKSIREISLCNLAYCHLQNGNLKESVDIYKNVLEQYPENITAKAQLNTINVIISSAGTLKM